LYHGGVKILHTTTLAKHVGVILYAAMTGSASIADARVIAACIPAELAVVITTDSDDIAELSAAVPGVKIMPRRP
jgi:hypothetical protein